MSGTIADWERERFHDEALGEIVLLPEAVEPEPVEGTPRAVEVEVLHERQTCGIRVELRWNRSTDTVAILVEDEHGTHGTPVEHEQALDAFHHPYVYLPA